MSDKHDETIKVVKPAGEWAYALKSEGRDEVRVLVMARGWERSWEVVLPMSVGVAAAGLRRMSRGDFIQDAFPTLNSDQRESLLTPPDIWSDLEAGDEEIRELIREAKARAQSGRVVESTLELAEGFDGADIDPRAFRVESGRLVATEQVDWDRFMNALCDGAHSLRAGGRVRDGFTEMELELTKRWTVRLTHKGEWVDERATSVTPPGALLSYARCPAWADGYAEKGTLPLWSGPRSEHREDMNMPSEGVFVGARFPDAGTLDERGDWLALMEALEIAYVPEVEEWDADGRWVGEWRVCDGGDTVVVRAGTEAARLCEAAAAKRERGELLDPELVAFMKENTL